MPARKATSTRDHGAGLRSSPVVPDAPDALIARGLCYWTRWDDQDALDDVQAAYDDLTAAIDAVEAGTPARGTPLDTMYSHRAFVAHALDDDWERTVEDLGRAVALAPTSPATSSTTASLGPTSAIRWRHVADLRRYLALADSSRCAIRHSARWSRRCWRI